MQWDRGYSATYYAAYVDPRTWRSMDRIEVVSGSVSRQADGLMESADIETDRYPDGIERWLRIYMDVRQGSGAAAHVPIFTGLATSPERSYNGRAKKHELICYSVLKPAEDVRLPRGWYALAGRNGADLIRTLLSVGPAPVEVEGVGPALADTIIAEDGESNLSMAGKVLLAIGWRLRISGDGTITVCPQASTASAHFGATAGDCIEPQVTTSRDVFACPNVFRAVLGDMSATAVDDAPDSPLSTVSRGREVWAEEVGPALADNESLETYAWRRLSDLQMVAQTGSYKRRYDPAVLVGDLVELDYPDQGLVGLFKVTSQGVNLGYNAQTSENVRREA